MNQVEANAIVTILSLAYPGAKFTAENAEVYERAIGDLNATMCRDAAENLIQDSRFLPTVAEIRAEYTRLLRAAATRRDEELKTQHAVAALPPPSGEHMRNQWGAALSNMLEQSSRHREMAAKWYAERGKRPPEDPDRHFIEIAKAGAKGSDVSDRFLSEVLPVDDSERRYP